jgi:hypothetical protein
LAWKCCLTPRVLSAARTEHRKRAASPAADKTLGVRAKLRRVACTHERTLKHSCGMKLPTKFSSRCLSGRPSRKPSTP